MLRVANSEKIKKQFKPLIVILLCLLAFPADWSCIASLFILSIGTNRDKPFKQILWCLFYDALYAMVYFFALSKVYDLIQLAVVLAIPVIALYNGERGKNTAVNKFMKRLYYVYYPLHLTIIWLFTTFC